MRIKDGAGNVYDDTPLVASVATDIESMQQAIRRHAIPALREAAALPCHRSNCGTVCLCLRCHARKALDVLDPEWRP